MNHRSGLVWIVRIDCIRWRGDVIRAGYRARSWITPATAHDCALDLGDIIFRIKLVHGIGNFSAIGNDSALRSICINLIDEGKGG
jgi:hypothetical protein